MIPEKITIHCSHGDARPLEQLQKLIPEPHYSRIVSAMDSQSLACLLEYIARYGEWQAGLSQQQGPRWAKASETPKKTGKYYCGVRVDGEFEKHVIEWDGKCWGEIEEYDRYDDCEIIEWLDESSPVTSTQEEKGRDSEEILAHAIGSAYNAGKAGSDIADVYKKFLPDAVYFPPTNPPVAASTRGGQKEEPTGFAIWVAANGWTLWPTAQEGQERAFLRPTNDANLPEEILFASELYGRFLQSQNTYPQPSTPHQTDK